MESCASGPVRLPPIPAGRSPPRRPRTPRGELPIPKQACKAGGRGPPGAAFRNRRSRCVRKRPERPAGVGGAPGGVRGGASPAAARGEVGHPGFPACPQKRTSPEPAASTAGLFRAKTGAHPRGGYPVPRWHDPCSPGGRTPTRRDPMSARRLLLATCLVAASFPGSALEGQGGGGLALRMGLFEGASLGLAARHWEGGSGFWSMWSADLWLGPGYAAPHGWTTSRFSWRPWRTRFWTTWHPSGPGWAYVVSSPCWHCWSPWRWDYAPYGSWWWDPWWGWVTAQPVWGISVGWGWSYYRRPAFFDPWWGPTGFLIRWRPVWAYDPGWWYRYDPWWAAPGVSPTTVVIPGRRTLVVALPSLGGSGVTYKERPLGSPSTPRTAIPRVPDVVPATASPSPAARPEPSSPGRAVPAGGVSSPQPREGAAPATSRPPSPETVPSRPSTPPSSPGSRGVQNDPPLRPSDRLAPPSRAGQPPRTPSPSARPAAGGGTVPAPRAGTVPAPGRSPVVTPHRPSDRLDAPPPESRAHVLRPSDLRNSSPPSAATPGARVPAPSASRGNPTPSGSARPSLPAPRASRGAPAEAVTPPPPGGRPSGPPAGSGGPSTAPPPPSATLRRPGG